MIYYNFMLSSMGFLRYFVPLTNFFSQMDIKSRYFYDGGTKYDAPSKKVNLLKMMGEQEGFELHGLSKIMDCPADNTFFVEGGYADYSMPKTNKISFTYQTDFRVLYERYIGDVDKVIFPNERYATTYDLVSHKNHYLGSPKYDATFNYDAIMEKYNLNASKRYALVLFPRHSDLNSANLDKIYCSLDKMGFVIILKSRGKEKFIKHNLIFLYLEDEAWYPHPSLEIMKVADIVINFDSTAIEESIMMGIPMINIHVKLHRKRGLDFMYSSHSCIDLEANFSEKEFTIAVNNVLSREIDFASEQEKFVCLKGSSERIYKVLR